MSAYSGTYRVEGKRLVMAIEDSSIQSWNGSKRTINIDIEGAKLTGTSEPFGSLVTGLDVVAVIAWERLEQGSSLGGLSCDGYNQCTSHRSSAYEVWA